MPVRSKKATAIRNRLLEEGVEDPAALAANPRNWRLHSLPQEKALGAILNEVGWVTRVIVNRRTGFLVDGHLRVAYAMKHGEVQIPVQYVELSEEEEALVLAALDPIGAMADTDKVQLSKVLASIGSKSDEVIALLAQIESDYRLVKKEKEVTFTVQDTVKAEFECPKCGYEWAGKARSD